uniref:CRTAC1 family protein n=1 Tax=Rhodothermus marinus TaxID=29549 RepID=A0A7V2AZ72_RHOMR
MAKQLGCYLGLWGILLVGWGCHAPEPATDVDTPLFEEVTSEAGLADFRHQTGAFGKKWMPESLGGGGGFVDIDGDGWSDIVLVTGAHWPGHGPALPALTVYRNRGDGTFENWTEKTGLDRYTAYGMGLAAADYDNDGDMDLFLTALGPNLLFRNEGGRFIEVSREAGLPRDAQWSTAAIFLDADRDGWLDLFYGNYVDWTPETDLFCSTDGVHKDYCTPRQYPGVSGRFFRNNGNGTFTEQTHKAGFAAMPGKTLGVAELDVNRDGWPDLVVANDTQRNLLFINNGDGTFTEQGLAAGIAFDANGRARAGMGIDVGFIGPTATPVIAIGNFSNEMVAFFQYVDQGVFIDRAPQVGLGSSTLLSLTFGLFFFDADLDGRLDLLLCNGHIQETIEQVQDGVTFRQRPQLFMQRAEGIFEAWPPQGPLAQPLLGRGAAYADYDRDGDLDVLLIENGGPVHLWRNRVNPGSPGAPYSVQLELQGTRSNRNALGTHLILYANGQRQERRVHGGSSYLSQHEYRLTVGLGSARQIDSLFVLWPSGQIDRWVQLPAQSAWRVIEAKGLEPLPLPGSKR